LKCANAPGTASKPKIWRRTKGSIFGDLGSCCWTSAVFDLPRNLTGKPWRQQTTVSRDELVQPIFL
jgi:hypothetical protein